MVRLYRARVFAGRLSVDQASDGRVKLRFWAGMNFPALAVAGSNGRRELAGVRLRGGRVAVGQ